MMFSSNTSGNNDGALPSGVGGDSIKTQPNGIEEEQAFGEPVGPPMLLGVQGDDVRDRNLHTKKHRR